MLTDLRQGYDAMAEMIFGSISQIDTVVAAIAELEHPFNRADTDAD